MIVYTYYRFYDNFHWFTRIGKFSFYSVTKPTSRQLRRWKKQVKGACWLSVSCYGVSRDSVLFVPDYDIRS